MTSHKCASCLIMSSVVISGILFLTMVLIPLLIINDYKETTCQVDYINSPTSLPNLTNNNNWVSCDCGRRCDFETACVQIYVTIENSNNSVLLLQNTISWKNNGSECTFKNSYCENNIQYMIHSLNQANSQVKLYNNFKNQSQSFYCYSDNLKQRAYLENELSLEEILPLSIIFGICSCFCFCLIIDYNRKDKKVISEL